MRICSLAEGISDAEYTQVEAEFSEYCNSFLNDDESINQGIELKKEHSFRVCRNAVIIAEALGIADNCMNTVKTAALLHDIGRFEQFLRFRTFADSKSVNHAILGSGIITSTGILKNIDKKTSGMIKAVVGVHNVLTLGTGETELIILLQIVRDADKLDILRVITDYYNKRNLYNPLKIDLPDTGVISPAVCRSIKNAEPVDMSDLLSIEDFKLLVAAWVFDINFDRTRELLIEKGYIETILDTLPETESVTEVSEFIRKELGTGKQFAA
ncbi:MAG: HD domain-containing protein [Chitinivibrionales bacterium]